MNFNEHETSLITKKEIACFEKQDEFQELVQQYQKAVKAKESKPAQDYAIGTQCAIMFSFRKYQLVLLPAIILDYPSPGRVNVVIITPITKDTVPCPKHFSNDQQCTSCAYSHGNVIPVDHILPFDILETETKMDDLHCDKKVWCKQEGEDVWKLGNIIDQPHGQIWRVRLKGGRKRDIMTVDMEHIMAFKSLSDEESQDEGESDVVSVERVSDQKWGSWLPYTTGFAVKMMKKMGYVEVNTDRYALRLPN